MVSRKTHDVRRGLGFPSKLGLNQTEKPKEKSRFQTKSNTRSPPRPQS